ncbi:MAG: hypothetical protein JNM85_02975 [Chthonomonas sp.]|nr:hypothetical protein [Chthonomonas sp.]
MIITLGLFLLASPAPTLSVESVQERITFAGRLGQRVSQTLVVRSGEHRTTVHIHPYHTANSGRHSFHAGQTVRIQSVDLKKGTVNVTIDAISGD